MQNILVTLSKTTANLPTGSTFAGTKVTATDSAGAAQSATLNGSESPPWSVTFTNLADGPGGVTATDLDQNGVTLGSDTATFGAVAPPPPATFPQTTGITVTPA